MSPGGHSQPAAVSRHCELGTGPCVGSENGDSGGLSECVCVCVCVCMCELGTGPCVGSESGDWWFVCVCVCE